MTPLLNGPRVHLRPLRSQSYQNALNALRTPRAEKWVIVAVAESVSSREQSDRLAFVRLARHRLKGAVNTPAADLQLLDYVGDPPSVAEHLDRVIGLRSRGWLATVVFAL